MGTLGRLAFAGTPSPRAMLASGLWARASSSTSRPYQRQRGRTASGRQSKLASTLAPCQTRGSENGLVDVLFAKIIAAGRIRCLEASYRIKLHVIRNSRSCLIFLYAGDKIVSSGT